MSQFRCDNYPLSRKVSDKIGKNGYGTFPAVITRAGVFEYRQADGGVVRELRHADDVFSPDSMASLSNVPLITEADHLKCLAQGVPINQVSEFTMLGVVSDKPKRNSSDEIEASITVYRPETFQKIDSGEERQLSAGYTVDVIEEAGEYNGKPYDQRQTNIIYGHVAAVKRGRAGTAGFRIDSNAAIFLNEYENKNSAQEIPVTDAKTIVKKEIPALVIGQGENSIRLDSLVVEESPDALLLIAQRNKLVTEIEKSLSRCDRLDGENTQLKADKARLEGELKGAIPENRLDAVVEERTRLTIMCGQMHIDTKRKTNAEMKKSICLAKNPKLDEKRLDGDYLEGVFDPILSNWEQEIGDFRTLKNLEMSFNSNQQSDGKTPISY